MHINTATADGPQQVPQIWNRIALPLLLFLAILTGILLLSYWLLLPRWTHVEIAGDLLGPDEAEAYAAQLELQVADKEKTRLSMALPLRDETYAALAEKRASEPELQELRELIMDAARRGSPEDVPDAVRVDGVFFDATLRHLVIAGDVGGVGPRSMTVLAYFTEVLRELPITEEVIPPAFERREDDGIGFHSPFSVTLVLKENMSALAK